MNRALDVLGQWLTVFFHAIAALFAPSAGRFALVPVRVRTPRSSPRRSSPR